MTDSSTDRDDLLAYLADWSLAFSDRTDLAAAWWRSDSTTWDLADAVLGLPLARPSVAGQLDLPPDSMLREFIEAHGLGHHVTPVLPVADFSRILVGTYEWEGDFDQLGLIMMRKVEELLQSPASDGRSPWAAEDAYLIGAWFTLKANVATNWKLKITLGSGLDSPEGIYDHSGPVGIDPPKGSSERGQP